MRLQLILPRLEPTVMTLPATCPYGDCQGAHFQHHQEVPKPVKDTVYEAVLTQRYTCLRCGRTFECILAG
jgi:hypothetical protein